MASLGSSSIRTTADTLSPGSASGSPGISPSRSPNASGFRRSEALDLSDEVKDKLAQMMRSRSTGVGEEGDGGRIAAIDKPSSRAVETTKQGDEVDGPLRLPPISDTGLTRIDRGQHLRRSQSCTTAPSLNVAPPPSSPVHSLPSLTGPWSPQLQRRTPEERATTARLNVMGASPMASRRRTRVSAPAMTPLARGDLRPDLAASLIYPTSPKSGRKKMSSEMSIPEGEVAPTPKTPPPPHRKRSATTPPASRRSPLTLPPSPLTLPSVSPQGSPQIFRSADASPRALRRDYFDSKSPLASDSTVNQQQELPTLSEIEEQASESLDSLGKGSKCRHAVPAQC